MKWYLCNLLASQASFVSLLRLVSSMLPLCDNSLGFLDKNEGKTTATTKPTYPAVFHLKSCSLSCEKLMLSFTIGTSLFHSCRCDQSGSTVHIHIDLTPQSRCEINVASKWLKFRQALSEVAFMCVFVLPQSSHRQKNSLFRVIVRACCVSWCCSVV